jgi:DNA polymerase-3 subunit gamma/tau
VTLALYRKYRPGRFADVVGQDHVTEPLRTALAAGRINHAYLFSGPRGCGKTSSARILARSLNCERGPTPDPCGVCGSCVALAPEGPGNIDVVELDAASHGGVDDARELRDRAFYAPAESRYRVFIVDEAHMVTTQGFNALLKIVEEPPEHLVFVFATTEPEKVLPTIRSRTHHYPFRLIPPTTMRGLLERICVDEGATVAPTVIPLVLRAGAGSARDSLSVLDQLLAGAGPEGVTYERAVALLGVTDVALIDDVVDALAAGDRAAVFEAVDRLVEAGLDPRRFAADLLQRLRDLTLVQAIPDAAERGLVDVSADEVERMVEQSARLGPATLVRYGEILHAGLIEMRGATAPRLLLELLCARMLLPAASTSEPSVLERLERMERRASIAPAPVPHGASAAAPPPDPDETESAAARRMFVRASRAAGQAAVPAGEAETPAAHGEAAPPARESPGAAADVVPAARETAPASAVEVIAPPARETTAGPAQAPAPARESAPLVAEASQPDIAPESTLAAPERRDTAPVGASTSAAPTSASAARSTAGASAPTPPTAARAVPDRVSPRPADRRAPDRSASERPVTERPGSVQPEPDVAADRRAPAQGDQPAHPPADDRPAPARSVAQRDHVQDAGAHGSALDSESATRERPAALDAAAVRRVWMDILAEAKQRSRSTGALMANATVRSVDGDVLVLTIGSEPLARRLSETRNTDVIADALHAVLGVRWRVRCDHGDAAPAAPPRDTARAAAPRAAAPPQRPSRPTPSRPAPARRPAPDDGMPLPPEPPDDDVPPDDEEAMLAEAAAGPAALVAHRGPEEVAIELLSAQLGAKAIDHR